MLDLIARLEYILTFSGIFILQSFVLKTCFKDKLEKEVETINKEKAEWQKNLKEEYNREFEALAKDYEEDLERAAMTSIYEYERKRSRFKVVK